MSFLRLGTSCVVTNEQGYVLLSKRSDLRVWNLPGGRLDKGERFTQAAAREVREETGIDVKIERFVGLYYVTRWQRMNVLFKARYASGRLLEKSYETLENAWFPPDALPKPMSAEHKNRIVDALAADTILKVVDTPISEYRSQRMTFAMRWISNLLNGQPEPRYPHFDVFAAAVIWDDTHQKIFAPMGRLPYVDCHGEIAPWLQLENEYTYLLGKIELSWAGIWYHQSAIHFAFAATAPANEYFHDPNTLKLSKIEKAFLERVTPGYKQQPVWALSPDMSELSMAVRE